MSEPQVGIVGGGLAGLAVAAALCERGFRVRLFEARRVLGGRAGSFLDPATGQPVDHCQHVALGCCTNLIDLCRRTGVIDLFRRDRVVHFFSPTGERFDLRSAWWLPAPLHLAPSLLRLRFLSKQDRRRIGRTLWRLARTPKEDPPNSPTIGNWLREQGETPLAIDRFWSVVLISALGETVDRASLAAARKVFVDGFMRQRSAYHVYVPAAPLSTLYQQLAGWLGERGAMIHLQQRATRVIMDRQVRGIQFGDGEVRRFDHYILAVPWNHLPKLFPPAEHHLLPEIQSSEQIAASPITSIHLWFDREITPLPHAVLIDRLVQWIFRHAANSGEALANQTRTAYYQVVISASRNLSGRDREEVLAEVLADLAGVFPLAGEAKLLRWQMITQQDAVFSAQPGLDAIRPRQQTSIPNLTLAGDWTRTGWPSTMESAVRSGYLAAEAVLRTSRRPQTILQSELSPGLLARLLIALQSK